MNKKGFAISGIIYSLLILFFLLLFGFLSITIFVIIIIFSLVFKHQIIYAYQGKEKEGVIEIDNLNELDLLKITNCKYLYIDNKKLRYDLTILKDDNKYLVKLFIKNLKNDKSLIEVKFLEKEESLLRFIINSMKGD